MAFYKALVMVGGRKKELPANDGLAYPPPISAAPVGNQQDWVLSINTERTIVLATPSDASVTSLIGGIAAANNGQEVIIYNSSPSGLIWLFNEDPLSLAANRLRLSGGGAYLFPAQSITIRYLTSVSRWVEVSRSENNLAFDDKAALILPGGGTSAVAYGRGGFSSSATLASFTPFAAPTNDYMEDSNCQITNATANGTADVKISSSFMRGAVDLRQGVFFNARFRHTALSATGGFFCGLMNSSVAVTTLPRSTNNSFGISAETTDTALSVYSRDATAATAINLGANFPCNNATATYEFSMLCLPNVANVRYIIRRLDTNTIAQGALTANLPVNTTSLNPRMSVVVGATAATNSAFFSRIFAKSIY